MQSSKILNSCVIDVKLLWSNNEKKKRGGGGGEELEKVNLACSRLYLSQNGSFDQIQQKANIQTNKRCSHDSSFDPLAFALQSHRVTKNGLSETNNFSSL